MIIELFGLPASGKTTLAKRWEGEGWKRVKLHTRSEILLYFLMFAFLHPIKTIALSFYCVRYAGDVRRFRLKVNNLFFYNLALWQKAHRFPKAIIDQGPHQFLLSLFEREQSSDIFRQLLSVLPKPHALFIFDTSEEVRVSRLAARGGKPRIEFGTESAERFAKVAEHHFKLVKDMLNRLPWTLKVADTATPGDVLLKHWSYIAFARMPTEKAHGASIAHMCASFAAGGAETSLYVPTRANPITEDLFSYYRVPQNFSVEHVSVPDFLGRGLSHPLFFFCQRLLFAGALTRTQLPVGVVYTRDPEIVFTLGSMRPVVFEAHRIPSGLLGWLTAQLVKKSVLVVCNSKGTAKAFEEKGITNTIVAPNGFDADAFKHTESKEASRRRLGIPLAEYVALYVGSLEGWKGVQTLYDASEALSERRIVVIGGSASEVEKLKRQHQNVLFLGMRPYAELADNLAAADVLLLPNTMRDVQSQRFTSPIKLFGYLASGKPIIASDVPSVREIVSEKEVCFVAPDDSAALVQAIETVAANFQMQETLGHAAQEKAEQYTWKQRAITVRSALLGSL